MGKKAKVPKAPDLVAANAAQVAANKNAATDVMHANEYSQVTPFASNVWSTDPATGQRTNTTTLAPEQQALYEKNNALAQQMAGGAGGAYGSFMDQYWGGGGGGGGGSAASGGGGGMSINIGGGGGGGGEIPGDIQKDLDYSKLTAMPTTDPAAARQEAQDALYKMNTQYLDPQMKEAQRSLEARLTNQGLVPGTAAYNRAAQIQNDASQKAYESARQGAIAGGGAEQERAQNLALQLRNQGMTEAGNLGAFHNAAQNQGANQFLTARGQDKSLAGTLGAAGIGAGASKYNTDVQNALAMRNQQFNELTKMGQFGQSGQMIPQFGISQGNMGQYGAGDLVGAQQKQYQDAVAASQAKGAGGIGGMLPMLGSVAGTMFGGPGLGTALGGMAGSALGNMFSSPKPATDWGGIGGGTFADSRDWGG